MESSNPSGKRCSVAVALEAFADEDNRTDFAAAMDGTGAHQGLSTFGASTLGQAAGFPITVAIVRRHRRRLTKTGEPCTCPSK